MHSIAKSILFLMCTLAVSAQTIPITPNLGLKQIPDGYQNWGLPYRQSNTIIDNWSATVALKNNAIFTGTFTLPTSLNGCLSAASGIVSGSGSSCGTGSGAVTSVFGRTGVIVAVPGDYTAAQVTNAASLINSSEQDFVGVLKFPAFILGAHIGGSLTGDSQAIITEADNGVIPIVPGHILSWLSDTVGGGAGAGDSGIVAANVATLTGTQTLTNKTLDGVSPATMAFVDPTSSIQAQLNGKQTSGTYVTAISVASVNGISGSSSGGVTPALTIALGAITPTSATFTGTGTPISITPIAIGSLPSAATAGDGAIYLVSDSNTLTAGTCTAGGANRMFAISNGSIWTCH